MTLFTGKIQLQNNPLRSKSLPKNWNHSFAQAEDNKIDFMRLPWHTQAIEKSVKTKKYVNFLEYS